jgi:hypothetical protein
MFFRALNKLFGSFWFLLFGLGLIFVFATKYALGTEAACLTMNSWTVIFLGFFLFSAPRRWHLWNKNRLTLSSVFFAALFFRGAYLEYPSDAWSYFQLITHWQNFPVLDSSAIATARFTGDHPRFIYLFYWSFLRLLDREYWRLALDFISAGTQTLILMKIYQLSRFFLKKEEQGTTKHILLALAGFLFTGFANLNYFNYLALSSNQINFFIYFSILIIELEVIELIRTKLQPWSLLLKTAYPLPLLVPLLWWTHAQGFYLLLMFNLALGFFGILTLIPKQSRYLMGAVLGLLILDILRVYIPGQISASNYRNSWWGYYLDTLGVPGLFALVLSPWIYRQNKMLCTLVWIPTAILFSPFFGTILITKILPYPEVGHRGLYILPSGFLLAVGIFKIWERRKRAPLYSSLVMIGMALPANRPWFGRFEHAVRPVPACLSLNTYDKALFKLISERPHQTRECGFVSDQVTNFMMSVWVGVDWPTNRLDWNAGPSEVRMNDLANNIETPYCGALINNLKPDECDYSPTNSKLHHWTQELAQPTTATSAQMRALAQNLRENEFTSEDLGSGYELFMKTNRCFAGASIYLPAWYREILIRNSR